MIIDQNNISWLSWSFKTFRNGKFEMASFFPAFYSKLHIETMNKLFRLGEGRLFATKKALTRTLALRRLPSEHGDAPLAGTVAREVTETGQPLLFETEKTLAWNRKNHVPKGTSPVNIKWIISNVY